jgi:hypothetical protein
MEYPECVRANAYSYTLTVAIGQVYGAVIYGMCYTACSTSTRYIGYAQGYARKRKNGEVLDMSNRSTKCVIKQGYIS